MSAILQGMAVLFIRFLFVYLSYTALRQIAWRKLFSERNYHMAQYVCIILSVAVGHLLGSFTITIIEEIQQILFSIFL